MLETNGIVHTADLIIWWKWLTMMNGTNALHNCIQGIVRKDIGDAPGAAAVLTDAKNNSHNETKH